MIRTTNFPNACKEVLAILDFIELEDFEAIPKEFIDFLNDNKNEDYIFEYNPNISFEAQNLLRETRAILAYIFVNYWGTEDQIKGIKIKLRNDEVTKKSKPKEVFVNDKLKQINDTQTERTNNQEDNTNTEMLQLRKKESNIILRLISLIKRIFRRK